MNKSIIEFNGKKFNADTGQPLDKHFISPKNSPDARSVGVVLDGVVRKPAPKVIAAKARGVSPHASKHHPQKSKTLVRSGLPKPHGHLSGANLLEESGPQTAVSGQLLITKRDSDRLIRAKRFDKSKLVAKFIPNGSSSFIKKTAHLPVVKPLDTPRISQLPVVQEVEPHQPDRFAHAIAASTSHQTPAPAKPKLRHRAAKKLHVSPKVISVSASLLAALLIVGFYAYQNIPNFSMRLAANRAGVNGALPQYRPSGFSMGPINYKPGELHVNFVSNTDERAFQISQKNTNWDSETLKTSYLKQRAYVTSQEQGKTIYIYDNSNATWIDGGIWYNIEGNARLNSDQLLRMARSL